MNCQLTRYNFFQDAYGGNLRFDECSPPQKCEEHQICNCTRVVSKRPKGKPKSFTNHIEFFEEINGQKFEFNFNCPPGDQSRHFTFYWKEDGVENPHAYFWCERKNSMHIEISMKGHHEWDCVLADMFFGDKVDTSKLFHGHSPSKIVNVTTKIGKDDVWLHEDFNEEIVEFMQPCQETSDWKKFNKISMQLPKLFKPYNDFSPSLNAVRKQIEKDKEILNRINWAKTWASSIVDNIKETHLFQQHLCIDRARDKQLADFKAKKRKEHAFN